MAKPSSSPTDTEAPVEGVDVLAEESQAQAFSQPTPQPKRPTESTVTYVDARTGLPVAPATAAEEKPEPKQQASEPPAQQPANGKTNSQQERIFTQAEVEALIKDRLDRQRRRYEQLGKEDDAEEAKAEASVSAQMTALRAQIDALSQQSKRAAVQAAVAVEAQRQGIDAGLASKLIDIGAIEMADTGAPKAESLKKALESLLAEHPNLRIMPGLTAPNTARGQQAQRTDADRYQEYFAGGGGSFWQGGGVVSNS